MRKPSVSQLKAKLDKLFSLFIRLRDRNSSGDTVCYTCGHTANWKKMQCGHFVPRQYLATRYNEMNCHAQCFACNMYYNGQPSAFAAKLEEDYGKGTVALLEGTRRTITKDFPYEQKIKYYKDQLAKYTFLIGKI